MLFGDKVVLHTLLLVRLLGPGGICRNTKEELTCMCNVGSLISTVCINAGWLTRYGHCKTMWVFSNHPLFEFIDSCSKRTFLGLKERKKWSVNFTCNHHVEKAKKWVIGMLQCIVWSTRCRYHHRRTFVPFTASVSPIRTTRRGLSWGLCW